MTHEFEKLVLDGHNYPTWAMDIKISLALREVYKVILPPKERIIPLHDLFMYNVLYIIRNHMHIDFKIRICDGRRTKCTLGYSSNPL
jgi:hypothetical protein